MAASFPDVSLEVNLHAKEGGKEKRAWPLFFLLSMVPCASSPVTCASRSPLFAKNKAPKEETDEAVFAHKKIQVNKSCGFTCVATRRMPACAVTLVTNLSDNSSILIKVCVITKQEIYQFS